eukprot:TRINITY_DN62390_c2_g1_i1.p2 TRINITY_DN62390_c2_g1~~TRINITY_DN62390_c2_g1_i1.p2  ORF type:complete len:383 (+),score=54.20 TRINITY_DN62390_c2_g1_i1:31-1179(+)
MFSATTAVLLLGALSLSFGRETTMCDMIKGWGYGCEEHFPTTPDGFVLGMFRIPPKKKGAPVAILQHGLYDSSATWVNNLPNESLGYILHDAGYDIWMPNSRGNNFSQKNIYHKRDTDEFWNLIDWDKMGALDMPTVVSYVKNMTGHSTVSWVGHSQGTTQAFAGLSSVPGLDKQVNVFVALAPVTYVDHTTNDFLKLLAKIHLGKLLALLGDREFYGTNKLLHDLGIACNIIPYGCDEILLILCGGDIKNLNGTRMDFYTNFEPSATSVHNLRHWAQMVRNGKNFQWYDWGEKGNMKHYGTKTPPVYNITKITTPIGYFVGGKDELADPRDAARTLSELANVVHYNDQPPYGHLDFVWGLDAHIKIYPQVLTLLQKYNPTN